MYGNHIADQFEPEFEPDISREEIEDLLDELDPKNRSYAQRKHHSYLWHPNHRRAA